MDAPATGDAARLVAVEGGSGAGKTTISRRLSRRLGAQWLAEAYRRLRPPPSLAFRDRAGLLEIERRLFAEDEARYREAMGARAQGRSVVADTGFLGPATYVWGLREAGRLRGDPMPELRRWFERSLRSHGWGLPDLSLYLDVPRPLRHERAARNRPGHPVEFQPRHERIADFERRLFAGRFPELAPERFQVVSGVGPISVVVGRCADLVRRLPAAPAPTRAEAGRVLRAID